jgi:hypothetical protein
VNRLLVALLLAITALGCGFFVDFSIGFGRAMTGLLRGLGLHAGDARLTWDDWFLGVISATSAAGMIGLFVRKEWGRIIALLTLGALGIWAAAVALIPESWREDWFSTWTDRWAATIIAVIALAGFTWLCSRQARAEFQRPEAAT